MGYEPAGATEKRARKRYDLTHDLEIQVGDRTLAAKTADFSTRGFCVLTTPHLPVVDQLVLLFSIRAPRDYAFQVHVANRSDVTIGPQQFARLGLQITGANQNPASFFEHMVRLVKQQAAAMESPPEKTDAQVRSVGRTTGATEQLGHQTPAEGQSTKREHRSDKRFLYSADAKLRIGENTFVGKVHDVSQRGIGVYVPMEMPAFDQVRILVFLDDGDRFQVDAVERERQVVERPDGIGLRLGLRVVRADDQFKLFFNQLRREQEHDATMRQTGNSEGTTGTEVMTSAPALTGRGLGLLSKQKYKFVRKLGKGGFADVFLVRDLALNREVAMKVLSPKFSRDAKLSSRFVAEAQIAAQFDHPNIATVYEVGEVTPGEYENKLDFPLELLANYEDRIVYFTMQFIQGHSIAQYLKNEGKLDAKRTLTWVSAVGKALAYAHDKGVVHRDIKPENIMVTLDRHVLVTDFGIAKILARQESDDPTVEGGDEQDKTRGFMGTPIYASPEQVVAEGIDGRSDLYSLGVMTYEMLLGQPPFRGERWVETIAMHLHKQPAPLIEQDAQISQNLNDMVMKCLAKKKEERFQSARELVSELEKVALFLERGDLEVEAQTAFDQESIDMVRHLFIQFGKTYRTIGTYPETHDLVKQATLELYSRFDRYFGKHERLDIHVESMRMLFIHEAIWEEDQKENAFCFNLYRDGIRKLMFFRGMPREEIEQFLIRLFRYVNDRKNQEEDCVTILFQCVFQFIDFEYVDSFYEDEQSLARIKKTQDEWFYRAAWNLETAMADSVPISQALELHDQLASAYQNMPIHKLQHFLTKEIDAVVRHKAIDIMLGHLRDEKDNEIFERHFAVIEDIVYSCLTENDLASVTRVFAYLDAWSQEVPESDPREMHKRLLKLKERLSDEQFLNELIDKFFTVDRNLKDAIFGICEYLLPSVAVKILFNRFQLETEEWRLIFLSELTVMACGATLTPLIRLSMELSDEKAMVMLNGFARIPDRLTRNVFESWLKHKGPQTRVRLVRMIAGMQNHDFLDLIVKVGRDQNPRFDESRRYAWRVLSQLAKPKLMQILREFMKLEAFVSLQPDERAMVIQLAGKDQTGLQFLTDMVNDQSSFGQGKSELEDRKLAAEVLWKSNQPDAKRVVEKMAKKLLGNRDLINHCKSMIDGQR
ncbi:MAG: protein kinase [Acidobacteria bacterium]|nr:protein kinase [Acidobacteriota bacterium]